MLKPSYVIQLRTPYSIFRAYLDNREPNMHVINFLGFLDITQQLQKYVNYCVS